jgi:hypothetical protein
MKPRAKRHKTDREIEPRSGPRVGPRKPTMIVCSCNVISDREVRFPDPRPRRRSRKSIAASDTQLIAGDAPIRS